MAKVLFQGPLGVPEVVGIVSLDGGKLKIEVDADLIGLIDKDVKPPAGSIEETVLNFVKLGINIASSAP